MSKSVRKILIALVAVVIVVAGGVTFFAFSGSSSIYYTQIDNSKVEKNSSNGGVIDLKGNLPYLYTLAAYDENGGEKEVIFGTSKELKEGAFIRLEVMPIRGVISWSEVQYDELPTAVQDNYIAPSSSKNGD